MRYSALRADVHFVPVFEKRVRFKSLDSEALSRTIDFIESWSSQDTYDRFGSAGIGGPQWLVADLAQNGRRAFIAVRSNRVVGLLDYVYAQGAVHFGIVVDSQFRRLTIGTKLVYELLAHSGAQTVSAECRINNLAAVGLLRHCGFTRVFTEYGEAVWNRP